MDRMIRQVVLLDGSEVAEQCNVLETDALGLQQELHDSLHKDGECTSLGERNCNLQRSCSLPKWWSFHVKSQQQQSEGQTMVRHPRDLVRQPKR